jgi:hypothetical protein
MTTYSLRARARARLNQIPRLPHGTAPQLLANYGSSQTRSGEVRRRPKQTLPSRPQGPSSPRRSQPSSRSTGAVAAKAAIVTVIAAVELLRGRRGCKARDNHDVCSLRVAPPRPWLQTPRISGGSPGGRAGPRHPASPSTRRRLDPPTCKEGPSVTVNEALFARDAHPETSAGGSGHPSPWRRPGEPSRLLLGTGWANRLAYSWEPAGRTGSPPAGSRAPSWRR